MKTVRWSLRAGVALCMAALLCLLGLPAGAAEPVYLDSGSKDMEKLTKREIADLLEKEDVPGDIYVEEPSTTAPYRPGQVKTEVLQAAADRLSALEYGLTASTAAGGLSLLLMCLAFLVALQQRR